MIKNIEKQGGVKKRKWRESHPKKAAKKKEKNRKWREKNPNYYREYRKKNQEKFKKYFGERWWKDLELSRKKDREYKKAYILKYA